MITYLKLDQGLYKQKLQRYKADKSFSLQLDTSQLTAQSYIGRNLTKRSLIEESLILPVLKSPRDVQAVKTQREILDIVSQAQEKGRQDAMVSFLQQISENNVPKFNSPSDSSNMKRQQVRLRIPSKPHTFSEEQGSLSKRYKISLLNQRQSVGGGVPNLNHKRSFKKSYNTNNIQQIIQEIRSNKRQSENKKIPSVKYLSPLRIDLNTGSDTDILNSKEFFPKKGNRQLSPKQFFIRDNFPLTFQFLLNGKPKDNSLTDKTKLTQQTKQQSPCYLDSKNTQQTQTELEI